MIPREVSGQRFLAISKDSVLSISVELGPSGTLSGVRLPPLAQLPGSRVCPTLFRRALMQISEWELPPARDANEQRFWEALLRIPRGQTRTYGELAALLGSSPRGIGARCASNPLLLRLPCHRVVSKGALGGYREGAAWKRWILEFERLVV